MKITLEIEQRRGKCEDCPLFKFKGFGCSTALPIDCTQFDLSTIKIQDNENQD